MNNFKSYRTKFEIVKRKMTNTELIELYTHCQHLAIGYDYNKKFAESEFFYEMMNVVQSEIDKRIANRI